MRRQRPTDAKIAQDTQDLRNILESMPPNPVPWAVVIRLVAPIVARLAVRMALKKIDRGMSDTRVKAVTDSVATVVRVATEKSLGG